MDLVLDQAIALFAGLNVVPKRSYLASYSSRIDHKMSLRLMEAWLDQVEKVGLPHGVSFDLDFHSVPANSTEEPLEKHYISSRSRSQKGILVFLARDAEQRVLRYASLFLKRNFALRPPRACCSRKRLIVVQNIRHGPANGNPRTAPPGDARWHRTGWTCWALG